MAVEREAFDERESHYHRQISHAEGVAQRTLLQMESQLNEMLNSRIKAVQDDH